MAPRLTYTPLPPHTRVWVEFENSYGLVVEDRGMARNLRTRQMVSLGIDVTLDSDGVTVSASHRQVHASKPA